MHSDINAILLAQRGKLQMLKTIYGAKEDLHLPPWVQKQRRAQQQAEETQQGLLRERTPIASTPARVLTPAAFDAMFGSPNTTLVIKAKK